MSTISFPKTPEGGPLQPTVRDRTQYGGDEVQSDPPEFAFGVRFEDLFERSGLLKIDAAFMDALGAADPELRARLDTARMSPDTLDRTAEGDLLLALAGHVEEFVAELFGIRDEVRLLAESQNALAPIFECKRSFVQRGALKRHPASEAAQFDTCQIREELETFMGERLTELAYSRHVLTWLEAKAGHVEALELAGKYAAWAHHTPEGRHAHVGWVLFDAPTTHDPMALIPLESIQVGGVDRLSLPAGDFRPREGFRLTDPGATLLEALDEMHYCIYCQHQGKDSCAHGLRDVKTDAILTNAHGREMLGCPLEERISEMQESKAGGLVLAPLAMITVDNPMCAGTGHRICNDCMVSCVFQRGNRDPVDIPQAETRILKDVLELPWGFEIYGLLTRWNPCDIRRPVPKEDTGYRVLVVGLGPAGYTLAHHLMNEGHSVVAVDGLKIEPIDESISGVTVAGERVPFQPVRDVADLFERLDERACMGFGGVAEYGITVRWDKNFLTVIRLLLERRHAFAMYGGVRFGGTIELEDAFGAGFDHVAMCAGAGRPTVIPMKNGLARGVRQASDFLMALQLTGAARRDSVANLHVRLPVAVIGGGLTAIDTCTEALAYYPIQVEKFLTRYETLVLELGEEHVRRSWNEEDKATAEEWISHAKALRAERENAEGEGRQSRVDDLVRSWGGSTIVYRRALSDAPSYRNNHEEVHKAFEEGIGFIEHHSPVAVELDQFGHAEGLRIEHMESHAETVIPARTILVAAGTVPNTVLARETEGIELDGRFFRAVDENGEHVAPERRVKPAEAHVLMNLREDGTAVSFFGDLHPSFAGNVVAAMASAKRGYPVISRVLARRRPSGTPFDAFVDNMNDDFRATVHAVRRLTPNIIDVIVRAPAAARCFEPGQFYRLQNYEAYAKTTDDTTLAMEGLALTGAWVDREAGLLSMIVLEMGGSSNLCALLEPGEPVVVMGPTGSPTDIPTDETIMLVGGGLGNAVLFSIGRAMRQAGNKVLYFAGYKQSRDRYKIEEIMRASDVVVWACDEESDFVPERQRDCAFTGNIVQAMVAYAEGKLGEPAIRMEDVDRVVAIGSDGMMRAVAEARHGVLAPYLKTDHVAIGSINSPMQCMMKEICAQCLQAHTDPVTGEERVVFSCFNQDQPLDDVNFTTLRQRLGQNGLQEKLTRLWIARAVARLETEVEVEAELGVA